MKYRRVLPLLVAMLMVCAAGAADKSSNVSFQVVKEDNGQPVRNASIVLHTLNKKGDQEKGGLELKADPEGKASMDGLPYGKLRVQVLARSFQTYGQDYELNQATQEIVIKLKRPQKQYSIYDDHSKDGQDKPQQ